MCKKKPWFWIFVLLISQLLYIGSLKFLSLPHIIRGILCGVGTRILKIWCIEAEIWPKQKFQCKVFLSTPFRFEEPLHNISSWYQKCFKHVFQGFFSAAVEWLVFWGSFKDFYCLPFKGGLMLLILFLPDIDHLILPIWYILCSFCYLIQDI